MCVWYSVLTCADVVFVVCDGGKGIPQNRSATWRQSLFLKDSVWEYLS